MLGKVVSTLPLEAQDELVKSVTDYVKSYQDPDNTESINENLQDIPLPEGVLQVNLGVPIIVICCKSDLIWTVDKNRDQNERILDTVLKSLREFCITYGASLFYTSSKSSMNLNTLYDYLMHRFYGFQLQHKPQILERDQIFIPSGWDSPNLIKQTDYLSNEKQYQDYLPRPKNRIANKEAIAVVNDQEFLLQIKEKIESGKKGKRDRVSDMLQRPNNPEILPVAPAPVQEPPRSSQNTLQKFYLDLLGQTSKE